MGRAAEKQARLQHVACTVELQPSGAATDLAAGVVLEWKALTLHKPAVGMSA